MWSNTLTLSITARKYIAMHAVCDLFQLFVIGSTGAVGAYAVLRIALPDENNLYSS